MSRQSIVIEFVGLPGVGKSTISNCFKDYLVNEGYHVAVYDEVSQYRRKCNFFLKLFFFLGAMLTNGARILKYFRFLYLYGDFSLAYLMLYPKYVFHNRILKRYINDYQPDFVLLDQWIIQLLWSMSIISGKNNEHALADAKELFLDGISAVVYIQLEHEITVKRIEGRGTSQSRFDKMDFETRIEKLKKHGSYLYSLFKHAMCKKKLVVNSIKAPDDNFHVFKEFININFKK